MKKYPAFHSRHIPYEYLNFETETGQVVRENGLCDVTDAETLQKLAALGVSVIETRLVWWAMEPRPGVFDFSRLERDLDKIEKGGLKGGVFPWFQHPPTWYDPDKKQHTRFRCLEHDKSSTILSHWDPQTLEVYDRLYGELAHRFGERLAFLYAGISGDFGEVCYPSGVNHYLFSPPHNHQGFWCGDSLARQSFRLQIQKKYGQIKTLNEAWETSFDNWQDDLMPKLPISNHCLARRFDFAQWYVDSLMNFTDKACQIVARHFPNTKVGIPLGFPCESLVVGQIKSQAVKIAARYNMAARWTGMAYLGSFGRSNVLARRFSSASHFYKTPFATEAALKLTRENAANGLYESLANEAAIIHDDPENIFRAQEVHAQLRPGLFLSPPCTSVALLYPLLDELLEIDAFDLDPFIDKADILRREFDYEICDHCMIDDGFLDCISDIVIVLSVHVPDTSARKLQAFTRNGGHVWLCDNAQLNILHKDGKRETMPMQPIKIDAAAGKEPYQGGFYQVSKLPPFGQYSNLAKQYGPAYYTVHEQCVSRYTPENNSIEILPGLK